MVEIEFRAKYLDERLLANPSIALGQAKHEIIRMGSVARDMLNDASEYFFNKDEKVANLALQKEQLINELDRKITEYMVKIQQSNLTADESAKASILMQTINDIERIGDHAENIVELAESRISQKVEFSEDAEKDLRDMLQLADHVVSKALHALEHDDEQAAEEVLTSEVELDRMESVFRKAHINRLNQGACSGNSGAIFLDIISNLERIGDHSKNIAQYILGMDDE